LRKRKKEGKPEPSVFERARDELFSQIRRCGVLAATEEQRDAWFKETMEYLATRYPGVSQEELALLNELGRRYCEPVIPYSGRAGAHAEGKS
jgi:hypothetical protein